MIKKVHSASATASVMEVAFSQFFGVGSGRSSSISDILGIVSDSFGDGFIEGCGRCSGGLFGCLELLLLVGLLLLVSALDFLLSGRWLIGLLIVGDIESLERIGHANNQIINYSN